MELAYLITIIVCFAMGYGFKAILADNDLRDLGRKYDLAWLKREELEKKDDEKKKKFFFSMGWMQCKIASGAWSSDGDAGYFDENGNHLSLNYDGNYCLVKDKKKKDSGNG